MSASSRSTAVLVLVVGVLAGACDFGIRLSGKAPSAVDSSTLRPTAIASVSTAPVDGIGPKPALGPIKPFDPKPPEVFQGPGGLTVWLVERPDLPIVSASVIVPYGSSSDPEDAPGTMALLADMLDEGAGTRDALQVSETIATLGASLRLSAGNDASTASILSLRGKFDTTFEILCDVVARPHLTSNDFQRTKKLWKNALKKRSDDPMAVASVVAHTILYGSKTPYGHPSLGLYSKADNVTLGSLKAIYARSWRPDRATLVVAGQITKADLTAMLQKQLGSWKAAGDALPQPAVTGSVSKRPKLVVVDRPKAVQTVIYAVRDGVTASDERAPSLALINDALGGSFTSRLNTDLREKKGWTYGIGSAFSSNRGQGAFVVASSVEAIHTGEALKAILDHLAKMSDTGLTDDEIVKVKAQDKASQIETYEAVTGTGSRLTELVTLGLPPSFDAGATRIRQGATKDDLARLAKIHVDPSAITIVVVGDRDDIKKQLAEQGIEAPIPYGVEGQPLEGSR